MDEIKETQKQESVEEPKKVTPEPDTPLAPGDPGPQCDPSDVVGIDIPDIPLEEYEVPSEEIESEIGVKNEYVGSVEFGVVGSGQCGGRIVKSFYESGYKKALALNTAQADLNPLTLPENQKLFIGHLQGSGKDMKKGEKATKESSQQIFDKMREVFGTVQKIIICVGFGGGTGAGGLEVLVEVAQKYLTDLGTPDPKKDVIVVAALPTAGELKSYTTRKNNEIIQEVMYKKAEAGEVGPIILIDNSKIEKMYRGIPPVKFWGTINDTITQLFQMFNYLSQQESSYTSFDTEDYKTVLTTSGLAVLGVTKVNTKEGEKVQLSQALQDNFRKTLLAKDVDYATAQEASCIVVANNDVLGSLSMDVINYGFDTIHNLLGNANVHRGLYGASREGIRAYTLITGMKPAASGKSSVY